MKIKFKFSYWLGIILYVFQSGCYPGNPVYTDELDIVYTNYDNQFNFAAAKTYAIPDIIVKITGDVFNDPNRTGKPQYLSPVYAGPVLDQIKQHMASNGWTLVNKNSNPDNIMLVSSMSNTNVYYYYDWSYWGWWYPGWDAGWGWYYPNYYYPGYVSGYRSGSVFIQLVDQKTAKQRQTLPVVWNCILNGLAEGSDANIVARVQKGIDAAFFQSPYLKH